MRENLSSRPQKPYKAGMVVHLWDPSTPVRWEADRKIPKAQMLVGLEYTSVNKEMLVVSKQVRK